MKPAAAENPEDRFRVERDADRELDELLSEVRVALPAATLLFGFLLSLPFSADFGALTWYARDVYLVSILGAVTAVVLLLGPVAYHNLRGRPYDKLRMVDTISHQVTGALASLGVVLPAVVLLVVDVVYGGSLAVACVAALSVGIVATWVGVPLVRRRRGR